MEPIYLGNFNGYEIFISKEAKRLLGEIKANLVIFNTRGMVKYCCDPIKVKRSEIYPSNNGKSIVKLWPEDAIETKKVITLDETGNVIFNVRFEWINGCMIKRYFDGEVLDYVYHSHVAPYVNVFDESGRKFNVTLSKSRYYQIGIDGQDHHLLAKITNHRHKRILFTENH